MGCSECKDRNDCPDAYTDVSHHCENYENRSCYFCRYLYGIQTLDRTIERGNPRLHHDYHIAIYQRAWNEYTGTAHAGTMMHRPKAVGFDLNYCPECGRKIGGNDDDKTDGI